VEKMLGKFQNCLKILNAYKYICGVISSIGLMLGIIVGIVLPNWQIHCDRDRSIEQLEQSIHLLEGFAVKHKNINEATGKQEASILALRRQLPKSIEGQEALTTIQQLAQNKGLRLSLQKVSNDSRVKGIQKNIYRSLNVDKGNNKLDKKNLQQYSWLLRLQGPYGAIISFLRTVEQNNLSGIDNLQLEADNKGNLTVQGLYTAFVLK